MKKLFFLILAFLIVGCSKIPSEEIPTIDLTEPVTDFEDDYSDVVDELETIYNATSFDKAVEEYVFTADIIDKYKGKKMLIEFCDIEDVFYIQDSKYLYTESLLTKTGFQLQLTDEQHLKAKALSQESYGDLCIIFVLTDIQPNFPNVTADLTIDVSTPDDIHSDFYSNTIYNSCLVKGTLIDIVDFDA